MSNTRLAHLLATSDLHNNDKHEVLRIFSVLSDERKMAVLDDFDTIADRIGNSRRELEKEKEFLLNKAQTILTPTTA